MPLDFIRSLPSLVPGCAGVDVPTFFREYLPIGILVVGGTAMMPFALGSMKGSVQDVLEVIARLPPPSTPKDGTAKADMRLVAIREFERLHRSRRLPGFLLLAIGVAAVAVGVYMSLRLSRP